MNTTINGVTLTNHQRTVLDFVLDHVRKYGGDSHMEANTSPKGDGFWVSVLEFFPGRDNVHNAARRTVTKLAKLGVLKACEITYKDGCVKGEPVGWKAVADDLANRTPDAELDPSELEDQPEEVAMNRVIEQWTNRG